MTVVEQLTGAMKELELSLRDAEKFDSGFASAGTRLRKQAQAVIKSLKEVRKTVQDVKSTRKAEEKAKPGV